MKIYIAAPFVARDYIRYQILPMLNSAGHGVTSSWLFGTREINAGSVGASESSSTDDVRRHANGDLHDVGISDVVLSLTANYFSDVVAVKDKSILHTGGRHVEVGYALANRIPVITVGEPENVFARGLTVVLPDLTRAISVISALSVLLQQREAQSL